MEGFTIMDIKIYKHDSEELINQIRFLLDSDEWYRVCKHFDKRSN